MLELSRVLRKRRNLETQASETTLSDLAETPKQGARSAYDEKSTPLDKELNCHGVPALSSIA